MLQRNGLPVLEDLNAHRPVADLIGRHGDSLDMRFATRNTELPVFVPLLPDVRGAAQSDLDLPVFLGRILEFEHVLGLLTGKRDTAIRTYTHRV